MLNYSQGLKNDRVPGSNSENFFVHRVSGQRSEDVHDRQELGSANSRTYWKSPYSGNNSIFCQGPSGNSSLCLKPELTINASPYKSSAPSRETSSVVRGILKNKDGGETKYAGPGLEEKGRRGSYGKLNLITTGTGNAQPHGMKSGTGTRSAGKRVQFDNIPKQRVQTKNNFMSLPIGTATSFRGRRLYFNRTVAVRVLGSPNYSDKYGGYGRNGYMATGTINSGESFIKSQINDFVKKLRLAESAKLAESEIPKNGGDQKGISPQTKKHFNSRVIFDNWREFDIERANLAETRLSHRGNSFNGAQTGTNSDDDVAESSSVSLASRESHTDTKTGEKTVVGTEPYRGKTRTASLYTKYRHITSNQPDLKRYEKKYVVTDPNSKKDRSDSANRDPINFCDNNKTSQILGWLDDVKAAQGTEETVGNHSTLGHITGKNDNINGDEHEDAVSLVAKANACT